jgi:redox-sensitive bicupin YhaK (pirin superfamily)
VIDVRRGGERFTTTGDGLVTRHSFSFGKHYDPANVAHGPLVAHNDDLVSPGHGYDRHPHADLEIVTWVLDGSLVHEDSHGHRGVARPGVVQRLGAGSGVRHSERNDADATPTRFLQMWLTADEPGLPPVYDLAPVDVHGLTPLASGIPGLDAAVPLRVAGAALHVARLAGGESVDLPDASRLHVFVARGTVDVEAAGRLEDGDAVRFTDEGGPRLTAVGACEVLIWQLP